MKLGKCQIVRWISPNCHNTQFLSGYDAFRDRLARFGLIQACVRSVGPLSCVPCLMCAPGMKLSKQLEAI